MNMVFVQVTPPCGQNCVTLEITRRNLPDVIMSGNWHNTCSYYIWKPSPLMFRRKIRDIVIARSSSSCKNFNVTHYSKSIKGINSKLGMPAYHEKVQLYDKGHNSESYILELCPSFTKFLDAGLDRRALVPHVVLLFPKYD